MAPKSYYTARLPAHYLLKIENVSKLIAARDDKTNESGMYESALFEAGGYNWSLVVYPNGDIRKRTQGYLSLFLKLDVDSAISSSSSVTPGQLKVDADVKFFVLDQTRNRYTVYYDEESNGLGFQRYSSVTPLLGIDKVMETPDLLKEENGYTIMDACIVGVEILISSNFKSETLTLVDIKRDQFLKWNIANYLKTTDEVIYSPIKNLAGWEWKMELYPNGKDNSGDLDTEGSFVSLYLTLVNTYHLGKKQKVYADFELRILEQRQDKHIKRQGEFWFSAEDPTFGFEQMIERGKLYQTSDGFVMNDGVLKVVAEFRVVSVVEAGLKQA